MYVAAPIRDANFQVVAALALRIRPEREFTRILLKLIYQIRGGVVPIRCATVSHMRSATNHVNRPIRNRSKTPMS